MKVMGLVLGLALMILCLPSRAEAKGIPLIYNTGDEIFRTGPLPAPLDKDPELSGYEAGYLCQVKGVMWSYFSVSDCKPVAYKGDAYVDAPEVVKAVSAKYTEADMQRGIWAHYGWLGVAALLLVGIGLWAKEKFAGSAKPQEEAT